MAAQSIGEPGTQLTMRTFHTGGVVTAADITQGLPRVEELFEAPKAEEQRPSSPKSAVSYPFRGRTPRAATSWLSPIPRPAKRFEHQIAIRIRRSRFRRATRSAKGDPDHRGLASSPHEILAGTGRVWRFRTTSSAEVQKVYRTQGVDINDKHIEVIVRQMMQQGRSVDDPGDTELLSGAIVDRRASSALPTRRSLSSGSLRTAATRRMR